VVLMPGATLSPVDLRAHVAQSLSFARVPKKVLIVDALPVNSIGKVLRSELRRTLSSGESAPVSIL
jgi:acyl-CoA synthetase (AMP-forming)/AMP-acid ligase II